MFEQQQQPDTSCSSLGDEICDNGLLSNRMKSSMKRTAADASVTSSVSTSNHNNNNNNNNKNSPTRVAAIESQRVRLSKYLVLLVLMIAAGFFSLGIYFLLERRIQREFETKFEDYANEVIGVSQHNANTLYTSYENLARMITSYAIASNSTWPFVTIPNFEAMGLHLISQLTSLYILFMPFVKEEQRLQYEAYSRQNQGWINKSYAYHGLPPIDFSIAPTIYRLNFTSEGPKPFRDDLQLDPVYAPLWQIAPIQPFKSYVNYNGYDGPAFKYLYPIMANQRQAGISQALDLTGYIGDQDAWPQSSLATPIYDSLVQTGNNANLVGCLNTFLPWHVFFENAVTEGINGLILVIRNCDQTFTFQINGPKLQYLGVGDLHNEQYSHLEVAELNTAWRTKVDCPYTLHLFPSKTFQAKYDNNNPIFYSCVAAATFFISIIAFLYYDSVIASRQQPVLSKAIERTAIVESFVPSNVRDRLMGEVKSDNDRSNKDNSNSGNRFGAPLGGELTLPIATGHSSKRLYQGKPIADFHPACTVMVADFVNFASWCSSRQPCQVLGFLECIFSAFDKLAKRRGVFKIETTGDRYVVASGLPEPQTDHAWVMVRFANACIVELQKQVTRLETYLGPETSSLGMRFGLASGPVTAGVLRGNVMRFQLMGATVKMAEIIESTGSKNRIHLSPATAELLQQYAKAKSLLVPRDETILVKGQGKIQTYWLGSSEKDESQGINDLGNASHHMTLDPYSHVEETQTDRLISWNVDVFSRLLRQIAAMREENSIKSSTTDGDDDVTTLVINTKHDSDHTVLDEVQEIIAFPKDLARYKRDPVKVDVGDEVMAQLRSYVKTIASMYRDNHFHSFEHACHVSQSLSKLLSRIVTPDSVDYVNMKYKFKATQQLHEFTYGLASDPITSFACAFSALIHDVDHRGIPNTQLIKEETKLATLYKNKSVAEQNSVDLAWELLMSPEFSALRGAIYSNQEELNRFRQLVVNSVLATDIVDKELGELRKRKWEKAFDNNNNNVRRRTENQSGIEDKEEEKEESKINSINRKATIVIEHLIQAADVNHTMQHWNVYLKWNERFFREMYQAYLDGRADKDPSIGWYEGELGFFDFYIIPLAKKLENCGVFGVSSAECLDYATANRNEWEVKGKDIVQGYLSNF